MLNLASSAITILYYAMLKIENCVSKVCHLQLALVVGRKTTSTDVYPSCVLFCQNVAILYTISRQIAISTKIRAAARTLIAGGGVYSYIRVLPD